MVLMVVIGGCTYINDSNGCGGKVMGWLGYCTVMSVMVVLVTVVVVWLY